MTQVDMHHIWMERWKDPLGQLPMVSEPWFATTTGKISTRALPHNTFQMCTTWHYIPLLTKSCTLHGQERLHQSTALESGVLISTQSIINWSWMTESKMASSWDLEAAHASSNTWISRLRGSRRTCNSNGDIMPGSAILQGTAPNTAITPPTLVILDTPFMEALTVHLKLNLPALARENGLLD